MRDPNQVVREIADNGPVAMPNLGIERKRRDEWLFASHTRRIGRQTHVNIVIRQKIKLSRGSLCSDLSHSKLIRVERDGKDLPNLSLNSCQHTLPAKCSRRDDGEIRVGVVEDLAEAFKRPSAALNADLSGQHGARHGLCRHGLQECGAR